jgi:valyl-tRNA synthetase
MSKSLGNGIDPLEVAQRFGADALRFTVISAAAVGTDIHLDPDDLEASFAPGRNFANKVWNAGRFTLMSLGEAHVRPLAEVGNGLELADRWILSRLSRTAAAMTEALERIRLHEVADTAYHFFWGELADWYLELVKPRLKGERGEASREAARTVLVTVLDGILRLLHPIIPFVTEELWQRLPWPGTDPRPQLLMVAPWPTPRPRWEDPEVEARMASLQELVTQVRRLRKEYGVPEGAQVDVVLAGAPEGFSGTLAAEGGALRMLARVASVVQDGGSMRGAGAHAVLLNGTELFVPLEGVIDLEREKARLRGEIERLDGQWAATVRKLENEGFLAKAPGDVVAREREKAASLKEQVQKLGEKLRAFEGG